HDLHRRALLRARFRQEKNTVRKLERREHHPRSDAGLLSRRAPAQPTGNHQMNDEKPIAVEGENDSLADTAYRANPLAGQRVDRWIDGSKNERTEELDALKRLPDDMAFESFDVNDNVREFRQ